MGNKRGVRTCYCRIYSELDRGIYWLWFTWGGGASNIVPVLYFVLGRQKVMPVNLAVSAVSTFGYSGVLAGPALIGLMAHTTRLAFAFLL